MSITRTNAKRQAAMHTKRLLRLVEILKGVKPKQFDMDFWAHHEGDHPPVAQHYCGTVGCALGWAAMDKGFNRAGLKLIWASSSSIYYPGQRSPLYVGVPTFDGHTVGMAAKAFFGLSREEVENTFYATHFTKAKLMTEFKRLATQREELE